MSGAEAYHSSGDSLMRHVCGYASASDISRIGGFGLYADDECAYYPTRLLGYEYALLAVRLIQVGVAIVFRETLVLILASVVGTNDDALQIFGGGPTIMDAVDDVAYLMVVR